LTTTLAMTWKPSPSLEWTDKEAERGKYADPHKVDGELDDCDDEPSLGSLSSHGPYDQSAWGRPGEGGIDAEDEHDGSEPEDEGGEAEREDHEPSLGWTVDGCIQNTSFADCDAELQDHFSVAPQNRTTIEGPQISAENSYRKMLFASRIGRNGNSESGCQNRTGLPAW
jgi:hypothetical protein